MKPQHSGDGATTIGTHLTADLYGIAPSLLTDETCLVNVLLDALREAGFHVINHLSYRFPGEQAGVTAIALLSESHAAFHTYPEHGYIAIDVFSCGRPDPEDPLAALVGALGPSRIDMRLETRGGQVCQRKDSDEMSSATRTSSAARMP